MGMDIPVPAKYCSKCCREIPLNGQTVDGKLLKTPRITCEYCAREAAPTLPPRQRPLRNGERTDAQVSFLDTSPKIYIGTNGKWKLPFGV